MIYFISDKYNLTTKNLVTINSTEAIDYVIDFLDENKEFGFDTENSTLNPHNGINWLLQIGNEEHQFVIDLQNIEDFLKYYLGFVLESTEYIKVGHNIKYDYKWIKKYFNIECVNIDKLNIFDTYVAEKIITNGTVTLCGLKDCLQKYLKTTLSKEERNEFTNEKYTPTLNSIIYAAKDVEYICQIKILQEKEIKKLNLELLFRLECFCTNCYGDIELNGLPINVNKWKIVEQNKLVELEIKKKEIIQWCKDNKDGNRFVLNGNQNNLFSPIKEYDVFLINLNSPKQRVMFVKTVTHLSPTSPLLKELTKESSSKDILKELGKESAVCKLLYEWSVIQSLYSKFGSSFLHKPNNKTGFPNVNVVTGKIHADFNQLYTTTGRISTSNPNLQNIPALVEYRECFEAPEGYDIITADYEGCELRIIAELSREGAFIKAFNNGEDLHSTVATLIFNKEVSKTVNKELRSVAKNINFCMAYGGGADKISMMSGRSLEECTVILETYFKLFPALKKYLNQTAYTAVDNGFSRTAKPFNRIRFYYVDNINDFEKSRVRRQAKNMPIQGTNADLTKCATVFIKRYLNQLNKVEKDTAYLIHQVHDEIVICSKKEVSNEVAIKIKELMMEAGTWISKIVKFEVSISINNCWTK